MVTAWDIEHAEWDIWRDENAYDEQQDVIVTILSFEGIEYLNTVQRIGINE